jgi:predicted kinase
MRAAVRSHVGAAQAAGGDDAAEARDGLTESRRYLEMGLAYLAPPAPQLIAVGGLSGSGKSTLARRLAPHVGAAPGARVVRSDVVRKRLAGVDATVRLGAQGYAPAMTRRTYGVLCDEAGAALAAGHGVIADAVFAAPAERAAIARVAAVGGVRFDGLWLDAARGVLEERVRRRRGDASDATPEVVAGQAGFDISGVDWPRLDAAASAEDTLRRGLELLGDGRRQSIL